MRSAHVVAHSMNMLDILEVEKVDKTSTETSAPTTWPNFLWYLTSTPSSSGLFYSFILTHFHPSPRECKNSLPQQLTGLLGEGGVERVEQDRGGRPGPRTAERKRRGEVGAEKGGGSSWASAGQGSGAGARTKTSRRRRTVPCGCSSGRVSGRRAAAPFYTHPMFRQIERTLGSMK